MQEHSAVCLQHTVLVGSVISSLMTLIGSMFGSIKWYYWITMAATLITTPLAVWSAVSLKRRLLSIYIALCSLELIFKILFITNYVFIKHRKREECTNLEDDVEPPHCLYWRYDDLNLTNAIVFHSFASIMELVFLIFAVKLVIHLSSDRIDHLKEDGFGMSSMTRSESYHSFTYGTFEKRQRAAKERRFTATCWTSFNVHVFHYTLVCMTVWHLLF